MPIHEITTPVRLVELYTFRLVHSRTGKPMVQFLVPMSLEWAIDWLCSAPVENLELEVQDPHGLWSKVDRADPQDSSQPE